METQYILGFLTVIFTVVMNITIIAFQFFRGFVRNGERMSGMTVIKKIWNYEGVIGAAPFPVSLLNGGKSMTYTNNRPKTTGERKMAKNNQTPVHRSTRTKTDREGMQKDTCPDENTAEMSRQETPEPETNAAPP